MTTFFCSSSVGVVALRGADTIDLLQRLSTKDLRPLHNAPGVLSTLFVTRQGKMRDWVRVIAREDDVLLQTSEPERAAGLVEWIRDFTIMEDVVAEDASDAWRGLLVHGSEAWRALGDAPPGASGLVVSGRAVGIRGIAAYGQRAQWLLPREEIREAEARCTDAGCVAADPAAWDVWRVAAGIPGPKTEFPREVNPLELRLTDEAISWNKGCYVGQEVISRMDSYNKIARVLMGFELSSQSLPAGLDLGAMRVQQRDQIIGGVTSLVEKPGGGAIGLAIIKRKAAIPGSAELVVDAQKMSIALVDRPFWESQTEAFLSPS